MKFDEYRQKYQHVLPKAKDWIKNITSPYRSPEYLIQTDRFSRLSEYFRSTVLQATYCVYLPRIPVIPVYSQWKIEELKSFECDSAKGWIGEVYGDTIFIQNGHETDEALHFHELIHALQYRTLGTDGFLLAYGYEITVNGYPNGPLERMARELETRFRAEAEIFSAEEAVRESLSKFGIK